MKTPRFWQSKNLISTALLPASALYGIGAWLDRRVTRPKHTSVPVISVGNATAGGAGKTPTTLALIAVVRALGYDPHILTRGYGGSQLTAHRVTENDTWNFVGDEALLLTRTAPTWVGRDRFASAEAAINAGATILICDDAHQHHALHKDISLLVIDGPYGIGNGAMLPAGPLREPFSGAHTRADAAIIMGEDKQQLATTISIPLFAATLTPASDTGFLQQQKWFAFAGIGRPEKFFTTLRELGADIVATRAFADHHAYREADLAALVKQADAIDARLITTAKDWVKIPLALQHGIMSLPICLTLEEPRHFSDFLQEKLILAGAS